MVIDFNELTPGQRYYQLIQTLVPRPIAWVLSENENGTLNLAPFSYFTAVCSDPALIMISVGRKSAEAHKDTRANIEARRHFVVHIPDFDQLEAMNASSESLPAGVSEVDKLGLETVVRDGFALPVLAAGRAAYACRLHAIHEMGHARQAVIYGEVTALYLDEAIVDPTVTDRIKVDAMRLDPIARLGANEYARLVSTVWRQRPK